ncbi:adenylyl-sulfate kinase [Candidatus Bathyarchaeota archaeon]|nr:adenylyl-sulfate kinase [Candidatus Bathyarchaeota archaeon]
MGWHKLAIPEKGWALWITGLPSSGKSTLARAVLRRLAELGVRAQILESDELRRVLTPQASYSEEERDRFYEALVYIGRLLVENGVNVIFDATANKRRYRDLGRQEIGKFMEVYAKCPLSVCISRDAKGIYKAAMGGKAYTVPGIQAPYEEPENPDVVVETDKETPEEGSRIIVEALASRGFIDGGKGLRKAGREG